MPVPINLMRALLGLLGLFFAHMLGRSVAAARRRKQPKRILYTWILRTVVALGGVCYAAIDALSVAALALAAACFAWGFRAGSRLPREEDLTDTIFPEE